MSSAEILKSNLVPFEDENGQVWLGEPNGKIICEAFYRSADDTDEDLEANGYVYWGEFNREPIYVQT